MDNREKLIEYLQRNRNSYVSANKIANYLSVTPRTVRNYVKKINFDNPGIIGSSNLGYVITQTNESPLLKSKDYLLLERRFYILRRLLNSQKYGIDIFDLADTLYVSESTVKSDVIYINHMIKKYGVTVKNKRDRVLIDGDQKNIRHLIINLLNDTGLEKFEITNEIQNILGKEIIFGDLLALVKRCFITSELTLNSYFLRNFTFHLSIAIDRSRDNQCVPGEILNATIGHLFKKIDQRYQIKLTQEDMDELMILLESETHHDQSISYGLHDKVIQNAVEHALSQLLETYGINFKDQDFKRRLCIHVLSLYERARQHEYSRNINSKEIKIKYPILFDMAVFLSSIIASELMIEINDDEIAYLALHIGSFLDDRRETNQKLKTLLLTSNYLRQDKVLERNIIKRFSSDLKIVEVNDVYQEPHLKDFDLIISTNEIDHTKFSNEINDRIITVSEFLGSNDTMRINTKVMQLKNTLFVSQLYENLPKLIQSNFFQRGQFTNKVEVISKVNQFFYDAGYVDAGYLDNLWKREKMSPTSFYSGVAIPHSLNLDAKKTGMMIMALNQPLDWDGKSIELVLGIAIAEKDRKFFNIIFQRVVEILSVDANVRQLTRCESRSEFINKLIGLMSEGNYFPDQSFS
ncbi:BglG family transcription antiterminator [Latilactobacillus fuchuensis]|uniref:BglG family transcription antiterminator n=1 Tax=Latilactobacillus fuchuensis TaxID=164393 RepID=UPI0039AF7098